MFSGKTRKGNSVFELPISSSYPLHAEFFLRNTCLSNNLTSSLGRFPSKGKDLQSRKFFKINRLTCKELPILILIPLCNSQTSVFNFQTPKLVFFSFWFIPKAVIQSPASKTMGIFRSGQFFVPTAHIKVTLDHFFMFFFEYFLE